MLACVDYFNSRHIADEAVLPSLAWKLRKHFDMIDIDDREEWSEMESDWVYAIPLEAKTWTQLRVFAEIMREFSGRVLNEDLDNRFMTGIQAAQKLLTVLDIYTGDNQAYLRSSGLSEVEILPLE